MLTRAFALVSALVASAPTVASAQSAPSDTLRLLADVGAGLRQLGPSLGPDIWPGFRPDTIPVLFVMAGRGTALVNWGHPLPEGFAATPGLPDVGWLPEADQGAASTGTVLQGRPTAQVRVATAVRADLLPLATHEAFHVFQGAARREGKKFGQGENSFLVTQYPVFSVENEAGLALDGLLLRRALDATTREERIRLAQEFVAVREGRHRALGPTLAEFESATELNEGLAQYAQLRARHATTALDWGGGEDPDGTLDRLSDLVGDPTLSVRVRFYSTGAALALLLDALESSDWPARLVMDRNLTLQDALAEASGYRDPERGLSTAARQRVGEETISRRAARAVSALRARRAAQIDSILSAPGVRIVIHTTGLGRRVGLCGIDPQNLLQADDGVLLHTRWVRPCAGAALEAEFNTPVVQDRTRGTLSAVAGATNELLLTADGAPLSLEEGETVRGATNVVIESPRLTIRCQRADLEREGGILHVRLAM